MFYSVELLSLRRKGKFALCWLAATSSDKVFQTYCRTHKSVEQANVEIMCKEISMSVLISNGTSARLSLYLSSQLMFGTLKILLFQTKYLEKEISTIIHGMISKKKKSEKSGFNDTFELPPVELTDLNLVKFQLKEDLHLIDEPDISERIKMLMREAITSDFGALTEEEIISFTSDDKSNFLAISPMKSTRKSRLKTPEYKKTKPRYSLFPLSHVQNVPESTLTSKRKKLSPDDDQRLLKRKRLIYDDKENEEPLEISFGNAEKQPEVLIHSAEEIRANTGQESTLQEHTIESSKAPYVEITEEQVTEVEPRVVPHIEISVEKNTSTIEHHSIVPLAEIGQELNQDITITTGVKNQEIENLSSILKQPLVSSDYKKKKHKTKKLKIDAVTTINTILQQINDTFIATVPITDVRINFAEIVIPAKILFSTPGCMICGNRIKNISEILTNLFTEHLQISFNEQTRDDIRAQSKRDNTYNDSSSINKGLIGTSSETKSFTDDILKGIQRVSPTIDVHGFKNDPEIFEKVGEEEGLPKIDDSKDKCENEPSTNMILNDELNKAFKENNSNIELVDQNIREHILVNYEEPQVLNTELPLGLPKPVKADFLAEMQILWSTRAPVPVINFKEIVSSDTHTKLDAAICFKYLLELHCEGKLTIRQAAPFSDIFIFRCN